MTFPPTQLNLRQAFMSNAIRQRPRQIRFSQTRFVTLYRLLSHYSSCLLQERVIERVKQKDSQKAKVAPIFKAQRAFMSRVASHSKCSVCQKMVGSVSFVTTLIRLVLVVVVQFLILDTYNSYSIICIVLVSYVQSQCICKIHLCIDV